MSAMIGGFGEMPINTWRQDEVLLKRLWAGDETAIHDLVVGKLRLVMKHAYQCQEYGDVEDIFQVGCLGLVAAIRRTRKENPLFVAYIVAYVKGYIQMYLKKNPWVIEESRSAVPPHTLQESVGIEDLALDSIYVQSLLSTLDEDEREVLVLTYFDDLQGTEVAKRMGISRQWVWTLRERALQKLRQQVVSESLKGGEADYYSINTLCTN
ncbi:MAG: sigma-70 family RNA polymerase sigma factor [Peptococcaceae bacterium]|nr:sigma-70 family RNA polymerase sigma factor [Peptococcaceae bacterium]